MALLFGPDNFEGSLPSSFDSVSQVWGAPTVTLDTSGKVIGSKSLFFNSVGEGSASAVKNLGANYSDIYVQLKGFIPSGQTWGAGGYAGFFTLWDASDVDIAKFNIEDYGTGVVRLSATTTATGYIDTGVSLPLDQIFTIEIRVKFHGSTGRIQLWLNNGLAGSPDYDSGDTNTGGSITARKLISGMAYVANATYDYYQDFISADTAFIGNRSGVVNLHVASGGDDNYQATNGNADQLTSTSLRLDTNNRHVGFMFRKVDIQGLVIDSAYLKVQSFNGSNLTLNCEIYAEDVDTPSDFTSASDNLSDRVLTTAHITWSETLSNAGYDLSPDIKTVIQEWADRASAGSKLVIILTWNSGTTDIASADQSLAKSAELLLTVSEPGGGPGPSVNSNFLAFF